MIRSIVIAVLGTAVAVQPATAQTACITRAEVQAAARFLLPSVIKAVTAKCSPALPQSAYLLTRGASLPERFQREPDDDARISAIIGKIDSKMTKGVDVADFKPFFGAIVAQTITNDIKPAACATIDEAMRLLDPLPPQNMVAMIELLAVQFDGDRQRKAQKKGKPASVGVCAADTATP